jgi:transposase-like protein
VKTRQLTREEVRRVVKMYREGRPIAEIKSVNGISHSRLYGILAEAGIAPDRLRPQQYLTERR